jgi:hypothetical protein
LIKYLGSNHCGATLPQSTNNVLVLSFNHCDDWSTDKYCSLEALRIKSQNPQSPWAESTLNSVPENRLIW